MRRMSCWIPTPSSSPPRARLQALNGMHSKAAGPSQAATAAAAAAAAGTQRPPLGRAASAPATPSAPPAKKSGNILTSVYGRLVGHLEQEEEVRP